MAENKNLIFVLILAIAISNFFLLFATLIIPVSANQTVLTTILNQTLLQTYIRGISTSLVTTPYPNSTNWNTDLTWIGQVAGGLLFALGYLILIIFDTLYTYIVIFFTIPTLFNVAGYGIFGYILSGFVGVFTVACVVYIGVLIRG